MKIGIFINLSSINNGLFGAINVPSFSPQGSLWEGVVMPLASRSGNGFTVLFEFKNIRATTPGPS